MAKKQVALEDVEEHQSERSTTPFASRENYQLFYAKIETQFEQCSPLVATGIALNDRFILTIAAVVTSGNNAIENCFVSVYDQESDRYKNKIRVKAIAYPASFNDFSHEKYNLALLQLEEPLSIIKGIVFPFSSENPAINIRSYHLNGFKTYFSSLTNWPVSKLKKGKDFLTFVANIELGVGGAPVVLEDNDQHYHVAAIYCGASGDGEKKQAIFINDAIRKKIEAMQSMLGNDDA